MTADVADTLKKMTVEELRPIVSQVLGEDVVDVGPFSVAKIGRSAGHSTVGIFRVAGVAKTAAAERNWSTVIKGLGAPEHPRAGFEPAPLKEVEIYRSRVFAELCGGVRAPHCYAIQPCDDMHLVWQEDLSGAPQPPWTYDQFIETARHLGQFNAHWPESALPEWPWLSQVGFRGSFYSLHTQQRFEHFPSLHEHPLARQFASPDVIQELMQLWKDLDTLLAQAERNPKGVCHRDCHPKNLFPMHDADGISYTIAIDWTKIGIDCLGLDIGHLIASPILWQELTSEEAAALVEPVFAAYVKGLAEAGWVGNPEEVRFTFLTRLTCNAVNCVGLISGAIDNLQWRQKLERMVGFPIEELCARWGKGLDFYFACRDEAQRLANHHKETQTL
jgi:hypothetical protein